MLPRIKRFKKWSKRDHTYYVHDNVCAYQVNNIHLHLNGTFYNLKHVVNINKSLNIDTKITDIHDILNTCVSVLNGGDRRSDYDKKLTPVLINSGPIMCTIEDRYFVTHDKSDTNGDNILIVLDSHDITRKIKYVIDLQHSGTFTHVVNEFFDVLKNDIKEISHVCPIRRYHTLIKISYSENSIHIRLSKYQDVKMCVDMDKNVSIINVINIKRMCTLDDVLMIIMLIITFIVCSVYVFCIFRELYPEEQHVDIIWCD